MTDPWMAEPRWWRAGLNSQVEFSWHNQNEFEDFTFNEPVRVPNPRHRVSLRAYRRNEPGWQPPIIYGPWRAYDTLPYRMADGTTIHGMTRLVDGVPIVYVHALTAPGLGEWTEVDASEVLENAA